MSGTSKIVARHRIVAFMGVSSGSGTTYHRMTKFTQFSPGKNPIEYSRQYVDEPFSVTDVMGYSTSIAYAFDKHRSLPVQEDIVKITNEELIGDEAIRTIILADTETGEAWKRDYAVIPGSEGDNLNVYTYSGTLKCRGELVSGTASTTDSWQTCTFTEGDSTETAGTASIKSTASAKKTTE